jgi:DNA-binding NarL/FixJ family response regulator
MNETILSRQEKKILTALSSGSLYKEIAADHNISINTVKKHLKNVYRKLNVKKRTQATDKYLQNPEFYNSIQNEEFAMTA